jgi:hypothetical protein
MKFLCVLTLALMSSSCFGQSLAQSRSSTCHSCTSQALAYSAAPAAGHTLIAVVCGGLTHAPHNLSSSNNTWTLKLTSSNGTVGAECKLWEQENSVAGADTVTATASTSDDIHLYIEEVSGLLTSAGFDASNTGADTTSSTSHSIGTSTSIAQSSEYAFAAFFSWNVGTGQTFTSGSGFSVQQSTVNSAGGDSGAIEDKVLSGASGAQTASITFGTSDSAIQLIGTWKASGGSPAAVGFNKRLKLHKLD